jgi:hypothetical protein
MGRVYLACDAVLERDVATALPGEAGYEVDGAEDTGEETE